MFVRSIIGENILKNRNCMFYSEFVKIHKNQVDPPLRIIVSQISTPGYSISKKLDGIIKKYMPAKYLISSTEEFIEIVNKLKPEGTMGSLDVESLYTSIPVEETIEIVLNYVYAHETMSPPSMPKTIMRELMKICTVEAPFRNIDGQLYKQRDGLAMGGPLSCTLANFYMAHIENQILSDTNLKPIIYARFIDDIFVVVENEQKLIQLKNAFIANSKVNFTHECNVNNKLPFLDVLLEATSNKYIRYVHTKPTNAEECIRYNCDAPDRYKTGVIYT